MINTKPTPAHIDGIKQYKRFLEKWDMWDFAYYDGKTHYFLTLYEQRLKGITGYLILDSEGRVVPFQEAMTPAHALVAFNTMIHLAMKEMVPQMLKEATPYQKVVTLLNQYKPAFTAECSELAPTIDRIIEVNTSVISHGKIIDEMINTLGNLQRSATRVRGYFDDEVLRAMHEECVKYNVLFYQYALDEFEVMDGYRQMIDALDKGVVGIPALDRMSLKRLLAESISSNNRVLKKSMTRFEQGFEENGIVLDKTDLFHSFDLKMEKQGIKDFEKKIVPIIRNPK